MTTTIEKKLVHLSGDIDYAVVDEGEGPAVLLLHGFPDSSYLWRNQIAALTAAGYRVIAPDLRGFGDSSKPLGVENYKVMRILGDVSNLLRVLSVPRAHVVGHDWGAVIAWLLAATMKTKVDHLVAISVGHPHLYHTPTPEQREKSWYMLLYQFEGVAEQLLQRHGWQMFREGVEGGDVERYLSDLARPGALTAALGWYRANRHPAAELSPPPRLPFITAPTLGIWGSGDPAMTEEGMTESEAFVWGPWRYERVEGAGHWVPLTAADRVNELLLGFLGSSETEPVAARTRRRF